MGFFQDLFGDTAAKAATDAAAQKVAGYNQGYSQETPYYQQSRGDITSGYGGAINTLTPGYNTGQGGLQAYADLTGANGVLGQNRAAALFQTDPGYQFQLAQALQATQRQQGTGGFQNSGNVNTALQDRAVGLAQQDYTNYANRLAQFLPYSATTGQQLAGAQVGQGTQLAGLDTGQGNLAYNTQAGIGSAEAAGTLGAAQARTTAANNIAGDVIKLAGVAAAPFTGGASLGLTGAGAGGGGSLASTLLGFGKPTNVASGYGGTAPGGYDQTGYYGNYPSYIPTFGSGSLFG